MSGGFFGLLQADGAPADPAVLVAMDQAMAYWGPDGGGLHTQGPLALGARLLKVTAEDDHEELPLMDGPHWLVARVRLDNRRELCAKLGLANRPDVPDSRLILLAYRKYGQDCVQHLMGDWSFALWDDSTQTLLIARDASGNTGVYYWWDGQRLVFSNGIKAILAHPAFKVRVDPLVLAGILTVYVDPEVADAAIYQGIKKLLPGHLLVARLGSMAIRRWWQPEQLEPLRYERLDDCYDDFLALYDEVVGECLRVGRGKVAATLSGGLDSGSVVSLAAPRLKNKGEVLTAFVHCPLHEPTLAGVNRIGDELALAQATAEHVGNIHVVPVRSEHKTVLGGLERALAVNDSPGHAASNNYWIFDILERAQGMGAKVLLTGQMGNVTVSYAGDGSLWPAMHHGNWAEVMRALLNEETGTWTGFKRRLVKPVLWPVICQWRRWKLDGAQPWAGYSFINPGFAADLNLRERMRNACHDPTFATANTYDAARTSASRLGLLRQQVSGLNWMQSAAAHGLDVRDPTRDRRILEFCWRAPDAVFWARGRRRGMIRRGMEGYLPSSVLFYGAKGLQNSDLSTRLSSEVPEILNKLETISGQSSVSACLDWVRLQSHAEAIKRAEVCEEGLSQAWVRAIQVAFFSTISD